MVSTVNTFATTVVNAEVDVLAEYDHNIKLRITGLDEDTRYYYRFVYTKDTTPYTTNLGRTRTAPKADSARSVRFAYVSCQDYVGRYYNNYLSLLTPEMLTGEGVDGSDGLDFVVHLGDYIYETTGDPDFQAAAGTRVVSFKDQAGALKLGAEGKEFYAAQSLDNYRELYKTYRTDELLQKVQENFPVIVTWDDHEFSDDSWQDTATYLNGAPGEKNLQRKKNSEIAYFEYMPIDHQQPHTDELPAGLLAITDEHLYPNTRIYRDFNFGQHLHLVMTDFRTNRPDHLLAEDAFPATVELDQITLSGFLLGQGMEQAQVDGVVSQMSPYINIDDENFAPYKAAFLEIFTGLYAEELMARIVMESNEALAKGQQRAIAAIQGNLATTYLNQVLVGAQASLPADHAIQQLPALPEVGVEQGLAFYTIGKTGLFGYIGSRYFVVKDTYDLYAGYKEYIAQLQGTSVQAGFDTAQKDWITETFKTSDSSWKLLGSSVSFTPLIFDFSSNKPSTGVLPLDYILGSSIIPDAFKQRFYLEADQWDGFPQYKADFVQDVLSQYGVVSLGGDVHSTYVTEHKASEITGLKSFNFTTSSVSSGTFGSFLEEGMNSIFAQLGEVPEELSQLSQFFDTMVKTATQRDDIEDDLVFSRMAEHGIAIVEVSKDEMLVDFHNIASEVNGVDTIGQSFYSNPGAFLSMVRQHKFKVADGELSRRD